MCLSVFFIAEEEVAQQIFYLLLGLISIDDDAEITMSFEVVRCMGMGCS
jgi:hypothetical protein